MSSFELFKKALRDNGYSLTQSRQVVFNALDGHEPLLMRDVIRRTASQTDRASVYRTIELFEQLGIVVRLQHGWKYKLELSDLFTHHHHHLTCTNCGLSVAFDEPASFDSVIQNVAKDHGFSTQSHQLEISGICPACQAAIKDP